MPRRSTGRTNRDPLTAGGVADKANALHVQRRNSTREENRMRQYTSAPWRALIREQAGGIGIRGDNGAQVCMAYDYARDGGREERDANARLIAAAPDLLEACTLAVEALETLSSNGVTGMEDDDALAACWAAIDKAAVT